MVLHFGGKNRGLMKDISVRMRNGRAAWLSQFSDQPISDAFRAANYRSDQINLLARAVRDRDRMNFVISDALKSASLR